MPLLGTGEQGVSITAILPEILNTAGQFLAKGLPLETLKIVARSDDDIALAKPIFDDFVDYARRPHSPYHGVVETFYEYDVFLSYSRRDSEAARKIFNRFKEGSLRVFFDVESIPHGVGWQDALFGALQSSRATVPLWSRNYLASMMCKEEFNASKLIAQKRGEEFIYPVLLEDADLPIYYQLVQHIDCRPGADDKILAAADQISCSLSR